MMEKTEVSALADKLRRTASALFLELPEPIAIDVRMTLHAAADELLGLARERDLLEAKMDGVLTAVRAAADRAEERRSERVDL
jgi:hypothetical protein